MARRDDHGPDGPRPGGPFIPPESVDSPSARPAGWSTARFPVVCLTEWTPWPIAPSASAAAAAGAFRTS
ncbi:hypothetical protein [Halorussus ruber]|uniref:hypothetical protein n=1 Tax=Halorussus ruber TaxID=1126238 RepID=UPI00143D3136|nr:hypothetical protein [Halorussus ruber]